MAALRSCKISSIVFFPHFSMHSTSVHLNIDWDRYSQTLAGIFLVFTSNVIPLKLNKMMEQKEQGKHCSK
jgi:hypothetical protein